MAQLLARLQNDFQRYMLTGDRAIEAHVVSTGRVPVATRLGIYGGGYGARLTEALQTNFPVLAQYVGECGFQALAADFIKKVDSRFASIRYYGAELPAFLADNPPYAATALLAELARWEWAMTATFDAGDAPIVAVSAMADVPPDRWSELRFAWHPAVRRLDLAWNVPALWKAVSQAAPAPEPARSADPGRWLMWRAGLDIYFRSLVAGEAAAIDAAACGRTFGEVCELLCDFSTEAHAPAMAAGYLKEWLQSGLITALA